MSVSSSPQRRVRVSVVCVYQEKILCFHAVDPTSGQNYYFLPGGGLEPNENEMDCGTRETFEETGYKVRLKPTSRLTKKYTFYWNGQNCDCETHFYRAHLDENFHPPQPVTDQDYNKGPIWIELSKLRETFNYCEEILNAVQFLI